MGLEFYLGVASMPLLLVLLALISGNRFQIALAYDQLLNAYLRGVADETISARAWRNRLKKKRWYVAYKVINATFFWQENHCRGAFHSELTRKYMPKEYQ